MRKHRSILISFLLLSIVTIVWAVWNPKTYVDDGNYQTQYVDFEISVDNSSHAWRIILDRDWSHVELQIRA